MPTCLHESCDRFTAVSRLAGWRSGGGGLLAVTVPRTSRADVASALAALAAAAARRGNTYIGNGGSERENGAGWIDERCHALRGPATAYFDTEA